MNAEGKFNIDLYKIKNKFLINTIRSEIFD